MEIRVVNSVEACIDVSYSQEFPQIGTDDIAITAYAMNNDGTTLHV
jgi:hypothetical protein